MDVQRWLLRQEPKWNRLEVLVSQAERHSLKSLTAPELQELSSLYRTAAADLARAQTRKLGEGITEYLQRLTLRAYSQVYQGKERQEWRNLWQFIRFGFPALCQQTWAYTAVATAVFLLGSFMGWWCAWRDPDFLDMAVPAGILEKVREEGELWMGPIFGIAPLASTGIMINNILVTLAVFVGGVALVIGGITGGLPMVLGTGTLFIMWNNGLHIGAIATLVGQHGLAYPFWAFVLPHGSLELPAIFLSGGAGLLLARGLVFPGRLKRLDMIKQCAGQAIRIMFGVVPMLVIAGVIEGFFSPNPYIPSSFKYLTGIILLGGLMFYLFASKTAGLSPQKLEN
jgi:uncharacterized membrane protein SpoIIM required for sporulation